MTNDSSVEKAERERYHVIAKRLGWSTERFDDGTYMSVCADDGWQLWQEARHSTPAAPETPPPAKEDL